MKQQDNRQPTAEKPSPEEKGKIRETGLDDRDLDLENVTYFGYTERPMFNRMSEGRTRLFMPLLKILDRLGVTPNMVTLASFLVLLFGFPLCLKAGEPFWAFFILGLHILLDGIDGPLSRYQGKTGPAGAFLDNANDVSGMVVVVGAAAHFKLMHPVIAYIYVVAYLYLTFAAIAQNVLKIPFRYVMKTKYPVYVLLSIRAGTGVDITTWFCIFVIAYMITHIVIAGDGIMRSLEKR